MHRAVRSTLVAAAVVTTLVAVPLTARAYVNSDGTDDIADVKNAAPVTASPLTGTLEYDQTDNGVRDYDCDDVYRVHLREGQWFYASMKGGDNDFDLLLFSSDATSVAGSTPGVAYSETKGTSSERFFYAVPKTGDYYLNAFAFDGKGPYTITWGTPSADRPVLSAATTQSAVAWGGSARITGTMRNSAGVIANREVRLYGKTSRSGKPYAYVAKTKTDAGGNYVFTVKPASIMTYDVRYLGSQDHLPTENVKDVKISPRAYLTSPSVPKKVRRNVTFTSVGYLRPKHTTGAHTVKVKCYRKNTKGVYVWVKTVTARNYYYSSKTTKYSARIKLPSKGAWRFRAYVAGDSLHTATYSSYRYKSVK